MKYLGYCYTCKEELPRNSNNDTLTEWMERHKVEGHYVNIGWY